MKKFLIPLAALFAVGIAGAANQVGTYPTAGPLTGSERILADQNAVTVNILPSQLISYFQTSGAIFSLLPAPLVNGYCLSNNGTALLWQSCSSTGTVTSIALTMPSGFSVAGSPITSNGTLAVTTTLSGLLKGTGSGFTSAGASDVVSLFTGCAGTDYLGADGACHAAGSTGTVTSVGISAPSWLTVGGSPVTTAGTITLSGATGLTLHQFLGSGSTGVLALDSLTAADLPASITSNTTGNAATATALASAPSQCGAGSFSTGIATSGNANCSTAVTSVALAAPSVFGVSGSPVIGAGTLSLSFASGQPQNEFLATPNGSSGAVGLRTIVAGDLPATITSNTSGNAATATALAALPSGCTSGQFATGIQANGTANCATPAGGGNVSTSGTPVANQIPVFTSSTAITGIAVGAGQVLVGQATGAPVATSSPILGASGTLGSIAMGNATSGTVTLEPVTGALGSVTASLPANTGTLAETNLAQTWSALQTFGNNISIGGVTPTGATGTGQIVFGTSPTLITPSLGAASATSISLSNPLAIGSGGTGLGSTPTNGQLLIGNGAGYTLGTLTAGSNISVTNSAGGVSLAVTAAGSPNYVQYNAGGALAGNSLLAFNPGSDVLNVGATNTPGTVSIGALDSMVVNGVAIPVPGFALNSNIQGVIENHSYTTGTSAGAARLYLARSDGSASSPSIVVNGDHLGTIYGIGFNGTTNNYLAGGYMQFIVDGTPSGTAMPSDWILALAGATGAPAQVMRAYSNGGVVVGSPTGGNQGSGTLNATGLYVNGAAALYSGGPLGTPSSGVGTNITGVNAASVGGFTLPCTVPTLVSGDYLTNNGSTCSWAAASGGGTVTTTGTPTTGVLAAFSGSTSITNATASQVLSLVNSQTCNAQTGTTYTFVIADANNCVTMSNAAANTITVPANASVAFPIGTTLTVIQDGAGATTVEGAGSPVTLTSAKYGSSTTQTYVFPSEYSCVALQKTATDTWFVSSCDYNPGGGSGTVTDGAGTTTANELLASTTTAHTYSVVATLPTAAMPALTGDVTGTTGSLSVTVTKVNGGAIPASAVALASNSSSQIVAATTVTYLVDSGTAFTLGTGTGACATDAVVSGSGAANGAVTCSGTTGAATLVVNLPTATIWACTATDITHPALIPESAYTTTSATFTAASVTSGDTITLSCTGST